MADQPKLTWWKRLILVYDWVIVAFVRALVLMLRMKSRDPREHWTRPLKADPHTETKIGNWEAVLAWDRGKRVGCFTGALIGVALGVLWIAWWLK
ncbi:MAG: hypothetical protein QGG36_31465 [Pirellulaceae bacterium]|nr:hypothetical protein [Pirellulaceae bacterium]MDP7020359.1 hypothetical protein [Pirellulaceae bacterium]